MSNRGRKKIEIDWNKMDALCQIQCTKTEIAAVLGVSQRTIDRVCLREKGVNFGVYFDEKREGGKASLRRRQWVMADSNPTMAIWLGKQYLKQSDKTESHVEIERSEIDLKLLSDEELDQYEILLRKASGNA